MSESKVTIVFVHGAYCDGSVWTKVLMPLAHEGFRIHTAQLPLESFDSDVASLTRLLDHANGPILLVGHSYSGAVITAAGNHEKVKALAYVCAFAPEEGEVFASLLSMNPTAYPQPSDTDPNGYLWLQADWAAEALGQDLHRGYLNLAVATQKPMQSASFGQSLRNPAWKHKPSAYLMTTEDRVLAPATQQVLAKRINARVQEVAASHMVLLSQPEAVTDFVRTSALTLSSNM